MPNVSAQYIRQVVRDMAKSPLAFEVLAKLGQEFPTKTASIVGLGEMGQCFKNAWDLAHQTGLHYVEGYACCGDIPLPVEHAWCVDEQGRVVDPTWASGHSYFGVLLESHTVIRVMDYTGRYGVFGNLYLLRPMSVDEMRTFLLGAVIRLRPDQETKHAN